MNIKFFNENLIDLYFFAPVSMEQSAGYKSVYLLCDNLVRSGINSYIFPDLDNFQTVSFVNQDKSSNTYYLTSYPNLITPLANIGHIIKSYNRKRIPIVIYPDSVEGNPLNAPNVIRYLAYYNKALTKIDVLENIDKEGLIYYSEDIGNNALKSTNKKPLFHQRVTLPVRNINSYSSNNVSFNKRSKIYYYGEKFRDKNVFKKKFPKYIQENFTQITRYEKNSPSHKELIEILKNAKLIHIFEDTALIYEALLSGCVVNLHPQGVFLNKNLHAANKEHKNFGLLSKENISDEEINEKQNEIFKFKNEYLSWIDKAEKDIDKFYNILIENQKNFHIYDDLFLNTALNKLKKFDKFITEKKTTYNVKLNLIRFFISNQYIKSIIKYFFLKLSIKDQERLRKIVYKLMVS